MNRRTKKIASMCIAGIILISTGCGKLSGFDSEEGTPVSRSQKMQTEALMIILKNYSLILMDIYLMRQGIF